MSEQEMVGRLMGVIDDDNDGDFADVMSTRTFEDAMLLTSDQGFVIRMDDGSEYQITVVQRRSRG